MDSCKYGRLYSAEFLKWISMPEFDVDFENLQNQIETDYPEISKFVPTFLTIKPSIRKDKNSKGIPQFYLLPTNSSRKPFQDLYSPSTKLLEKNVNRLLDKRYSIPEFFIRPLLFQIDPRSIDTRNHQHNYIRFKSLAPLGEILDRVSRAEQLFSILIYNRGRNYLIPDDFGFYVASFMKTKEDFKKIKNNEEQCSYFARYILSNLTLIYDPENRGRITRQNFVKHDFLRNLDEIFNFDKFLEIYNLFNDLDIRKSKRLSFDELLLFDHKRIHPKVMERVWKYLPGNRIDEEISFGSFVFYILLLEEKEREASLNFWFRVCDFDEDGILSLREMEVWFSYQKQMLKAMNADTEDFTQLVPQIMDMMGTNDIHWTRSQIKSSEHWPRLFNILIDPKLFYGYFALTEDYSPNIS